MKELRLKNMRFSSNDEYESSKHILYENSRNHYSYVVLKISKAHFPYYKRDPITNFFGYFECLMMNRYYPVDHEYLGHFVPYKGGLPMVRIERESITEDMMGDLFRSSEYEPIKDISLFSAISFSILNNRLIGKHRM